MSHMQTTTDQLGLQLDLKYKYFSHFIVAWDKHTINDHK